MLELTCLAQPPSILTLLHSFLTLGDTKGHEGLKMQAIAILSNPCCKSEENRVGGWVGQARGSHAAARLRMGAAVAAPKPSKVGIRSTKTCHVGQLKP